MLFKISILLFVFAVVSVITGLLINFLYSVFTDEEGCKAACFAYHTAAVLASACMFVMMVGFI